MLKNETQMFSNKHLTLTC